MRSVTQSKAQPTGQPQWARRALCADADCWPLPPPPPRPLASHYRLPLLGQTGAAGLAYQAGRAFLIEQEIGPTRKPNGVRAAAAVQLIFNFNGRRPGRQLSPAAPTARAAAAVQLAVGGPPVRLRPDWRQPDKRQSGQAGWLLAGWPTEIGLLKNGGQRWRAGGRLSEIPFEGSPGQPGSSRVPAASASSGDKGAASGGSGEGSGQRGRGTAMGDYNFLRPFQATGSLCRKLAKETTIGEPKAAHLSGYSHRRWLCE